MIDRFTSGLLRFTSLGAAFTGMYLGFNEEYAHAAYIMGLGIFNLVLAKDIV